MDTLTTAGWPKRPYRGLDYYRESEAVLFGGRTADIKSCADLLLGFGVKVLLLQGSSGSGKSSFLRAGLIPFLKRTTEADAHHQSFFLDAEESVIRCTIDPLKEIGRSILAAVNTEFPFSPGYLGERHRVSDEVREEIRAHVELAKSGTLDKSYQHLVDALALLSADLPGRLIIILDQAEEVLTRSDGTSDSSCAASAFFRFLEDVYLRNIDARIIVSLRTEYYGRFRDELAISDNRFSNKATRGAVEPFLLRPLRDEEALYDIILAPTRADKPYNFSMDEVLARKIIRELLEQLPYASVTPALQVVCSSLYLGLTPTKRRIVERDYYHLGAFQGIVRKYLEDGIAVAKPASEREAEEWHFLLHSLVSRQGGGTIVSLTETLNELEARAAKRKIPGPIGPRLIKLAGGAVPLLRAEPPSNPQFFSLKHDVLALVLSRWFDEHDGAVRARDQERARNERIRLRERVIFVGVLAVFLAIIGAVAFVLYDRGESTFQARKTSVGLRNAYAERAPQGNYRQSLLLTLANLNRIADRTNFYEELWAHGELHDETIKTLGEILPRVPRFAGDGYLAVGIDGQSGRIALLKQSGSARGLVLEVLSLPQQDRVGDLSSVKAFEIPADRLEAVSKGNMFLTTAGFLEDIGPAVYAGGRLFFWENGKLEDRDILSALPQELRQPIPRAEFIGGQLQLVYVNWMAAEQKIRGLSLTSDALRRQPVPVQERYKTFYYIRGEPFPVVSSANGRPPSMTSLVSTPLENEPEPGIPVEKVLPGDKDQKQFLLSASVGRSDSDNDDDVKVPLAVVVRQPQPQSPLTVLERRKVTIGLVEDADALVFKMDGPQFQIIDLDAERIGGAKRRRFLVLTFPGGNWSVQESTLAFLHSPIAAAKSGDRWRAAWLTEDGVRSLTTQGLDGGIAELTPRRPLMSGEPGGVKLQFALQGQFLILLQQKQWGAGINVKVWDLRATWTTWLRAANEVQMIDLACKVIRGAGTSSRLSEVDMEQFQVAPAHRDPCSQKGGT